MARRTKVNAFQLWVLLVTDRLTRRHNPSDIWTALDRRPAKDRTDSTPWDLYTDFSQEGDYVYEFYTNYERNARGMQINYVVNKVLGPDFWTEA